MSLCTGCGLTVDGNGVLKANLCPNGGISCADTTNPSPDGCTSGLYVKFPTPTIVGGVVTKPSNLGCGITVDTTGKLTAQSTSVDVATACDVTKGTASGTTDCGCLTGKNGLICDSVSGQLWAPGKVPFYGTGTQSVLTGVGTLGDMLGPISTPADFNGPFGPHGTDAVFGQSGAEALFWEVSNQTCYEARGLITANIQLPVFFVRRGESFVFSVWERLSYKASLDGLPLTGPWSLQSQQTIDLRWMTAARNFGAGSGQAYTNVLFDFSNVAIGPGQTARGESVVTVSRSNNGPDTPGAVNNVFVNLGPQRGNYYQHEYRVLFAAGHTLMAHQSDPTGSGNGGTLINGVVQGATKPNFFNV